MAKHPDTLGIALDARDKGIVAIPCRPGTKIPVIAWKRWQTEVPPEELVREWFSVRRNIALLTTGMVVFDCDDPAKAELVIEKCGETSHKLKTPRGGIHLGYRRRMGVILKNSVKIKGLDIDIRTSGGIEVIPNSETEDGRYEWLSSGLRPISELPCGNIGWTRERTKKQVVQTGPLTDLEPDRAKMVRRARAWIACVEGAVSGQRGHDRTFRVCCRLTHFDPNCFGLAFEEALPILLEWNEQCEPPWSDSELIHKLADAIQKRR